MSTTPVASFRDVFWLNDLVNVFCQNVRSCNQKPITERSRQVPMAESPMVAPTAISRPPSLRC